MDNRTRLEIAAPAGRASVADRVGAMHGSPSQVDVTKKAAFSEGLVKWYDRTRRPFPWRESADPYYVTICEVLLQRTNAEKVEKVAAEFFDRFPVPASIGEGSLPEVKRILKPLGLPHRVQQVIGIAESFRQIRSEGREVGDMDLANMPGVGQYVLSAVRVLALGQADAVIDEHVLRQFRRVFRLAAPARRHPTRGIRDFALSLVPCHRAKEYNLSILDLGRLICRPRNPRCHECPLEGICDYADTGVLEVGSAA